MNLSVSNKKTLVKELHLIHELMDRYETPEDKMYFFSAVYGIANRIMNLEFDEELSFLHYVTNAAHNTINGALAAASQRRSTPTIPPQVFQKLQDAVKELCTLIDEGKQTYSVLEKISNLAYSTTGNGYYLYLKGYLKIS
jgi:hypothetical protein